MDMESCLAFFHFAESRDFLLAIEPDVETGFQGPGCVFNVDLHHLQEGVFIFDEEHGWFNGCQT